MSALGNSERSFQQWDVLLTLIRNAAVPGGQLAAINLVESVAPPEQGVFPVVGVQFSDYAETTYGNRTHKITSTFDVVVAVQQKFDARSPIVDTTSSALTALRPLVNDGAGNGMSPLLRANPTLGGLCYRSYIQSMRYLVAQDAASSAGTIATAAYAYVCEDVVRF